MNFIEDYQLDIDKGFMCKVNGIAYQFDFKYSTRKYLYYVSNILKLADLLEINRSELKGIFNNETAYDVIYCDSKQECYDLCLHIIKTYFRPKQTETDKKEWCEKSRRHLAKYYYNDQYGINLPERSFSLRRYNGATWYWHNNNLKDPSNCIYSQFKLSKGQALEICNKLNLSCTLYATVPTFENPNDAIKFTDYLIETYIIKKEKTYDTNQLRKERTAISRGAKPAGGIIHGRRSKASVRCGRIEHKACLGN